MAHRRRAAGRDHELSSTPTRVRRRTLGWTLLALGLAAWPGAWLIDRILGVEVTVLARVRTPEEREAWLHSGWDVRDGVAELYGIVEPPPGLRVVVWDRSRLLRPPEDATLRLLPVDRRAGEDVLTGRALQFRAAVLGFLVALLGVVVLAFCRRERRAST